jgi:hypothetical protein
MAIETEEQKLAVAHDLPHNSRTHGRAQRYRDDDDVRWCGDRYGQCSWDRVRSHGELYNDLDVSDGFFVRREIARGDLL